MNKPQLQHNIKSSVEEIIGSVLVTDIFLYGSRTYGTAKVSSDWDLIAICEDVKNGQQFEKHNLNITSYTAEHFQEKLDEGKPFAIECFIALPQHKLFSNTKFKLDPKKVSTDAIYKKIEEDKQKLIRDDVSYDKKIKIKLYNIKLNRLISYLEGHKISMCLKDEYLEILEGKEPEEVLKLNPYGKSE